MPAENIIERAFSGGEISPALYTRTDISKYQTGLRTLRNMICMRHGGVTQRPGTMYVGTALNGGNPVRLIPFIYNETVLGQSYVLEFGNQYIAFYQNGGVVISAPNTPYKITSPYLQADLQNLQFAQSGDIVTIVNQNYAPAELKRLAPTNWVLTQNIQNLFGSPVPGPNSYSITGTAAGTNVGYIVTSVNALGEESDTSNVTLGVGSNIAQATVTTPVTISWTAVPNAITYRIYGTIQGSATMGYIGSTNSTSYTDPGTAPDFSQHWPINYNPFPGVGNYPATVGFTQQRRYFANTVNNPIGFWGSYPGDYYNFDYHIIGEDSDAIIGSLASDQVNAIQHILELKFMLMFTAGTEIYVQGNGSGVVTPSAINASTQSQYGCSALKVLKVGDVCLFNQSLGAFIRDFVFDFVIDGYRGNDITVFSSHLFEGHQIVDWAYQKVPDSIIWAVREDGVLLSCTYIREQQILAWARHDFNGGFVENVVAIPENGEYAVYASIRRTIGYTQLAQFQIVAGLNDSIDLQMSNTQTIYSAFIPAGSYTSTTLAAAIVAALNFLSIPSGDPSPISWVCTFTGGVFDIGQNNAYPSGSVNYRFLWASGPYAPRSAAISLGWTATDTGYSSNPGPNTYDQIAPNTPGQPILPGTTTVRYIERLSSRIWADPTGNGVQYDPINASYLDCFVEYDGRNYAANSSIPQNGAIGMTLEAGVFETGDTAYQQVLTLTADWAFFTSAMVGDEIFLYDEQFISSQGRYGNEVRCTIQYFISSSPGYSAVAATPNKAVPAEFQNMTTTLWSHAVKTVSGLGYLAGQQVSIWADRYVVGSPLNLQITPYTVPISGVLTLDKPYSVIYIGLPMTADFETLQIDTSFGDSVMGERKAISRLTVYLYNSRGFFGGTQNPDYDPDNLVNGVVQDPLFNLIEEKQQGNRQTYDAPPSLMTESQSTNIPVNWSKEGRIFIRNVDPIPLSILAVVPAGLTSAKVAWSQKV